MGLDSTVYSIREAPRSAVDFMQPAKNLHYWRKHWSLHRWMERLYREKGGVSLDFNLVCLQLTAEDLDRLEAAVTAGELPSFWRADPNADELQAEIDLEFIGKARGALDAGLKLFYSASY
jgi:hypothetical protein